MSFNGISVDRKQIWKIEKGLPNNETKFSKTTITKNDN